MATKIYCKTTAAGVQTFYLNFNGTSYYLFKQAYRVSVRDYFRGGVYINGINDYTHVHSQSVKNTLEKLPSYIRYLEKEQGIEVFRQTKQRKAEKRKGYKREKYRWQADEFAVEYEEIMRAA